MNFKNNLFESYLENLHSDNECRVFSCMDVSDLLCRYGDVYQSFHCNEVFMVERDDEHFCGIKANHLVVEVGWSEALMEDYNVFIVTGNHKGNRCVTVLIDDTKTGRRKKIEELRKYIENQMNDNEREE